MERCTFLSTLENKEECFSECVFNNLDDGDCPFKNIVLGRNKKISEFFRYELLELNDSLKLDNADEDYFEGIEEQFL